MAGKDRRHGARRSAAEGETVPTPGTRRPRPLTWLRPWRRDNKGERGRRWRMTLDGGRMGEMTPREAWGPAAEEEMTTKPGTLWPRPPSRLRPRWREPEGARGQHRRQSQKRSRQGGGTPQGERERRGDRPTRHGRRAPPQTGRERLTQAATGGTAQPSGRKGGTTPQGARAQICEWPTRWPRPPMRLRPQRREPKGE